MLDLNGTWELRYHPENEGTWDTPAALIGRPSIPAQVPGNVELDLVAAGVEPDPFFGDNLYRFRKYEFYEWWFTRAFALPEGWAGQRLALTFEGVNTFADVFVNGQQVGSCDNMFIAHTFEVGGAVRPGTNELAVRIRSAANVTRGMEYAAGVSGGEHIDDMIWQRKPPHSFGWDIMPRLPSAGLWRGVRLEVEPPTRLVETYYATLRLAHNRAELTWKYRFATDDPYLEGFAVRVRGVCGGSVFEAEQPALFVSGEGRMTVEYPRLWWPRGYGEAALYTVTMELLHHGEVVDSRTERIGIRQLQVEHRMEPGDAGEFRVVVNGCPILVKGSNWVPLDAMHSRDAARLPQALALADEVGCNMLRCWGGNVYEDHAFFDHCDEQGMLVWQDFAMACAVYPQEERFYAMIRREAAAVIRKLRNHACILLWAGDNEVDEGLTDRGVPEANRWNAITRAVLPEVVRLHDPYRLFLPSSPYIPAGIARYDVPEQHNWGARAYFKDDFYKHSNAHFISECGYHGCPAPESLAKFLPADALWPMGNRHWDTHNTDNLLNVPRGYNRNQLMADQVAILAGGVPEDLPTFSALSQLSQAEAKKFFVERTRLKKWRRTGILWWNLIDGWPQISDAVVDYYHVKKLAFTWLKRVMAPLCLLMDEREDWGRAIVLGNDSRTAYDVDWQVEDEDGTVMLAGHDHSPANENVTVGSLRELAGTQRLYVLRWQADDGTRGVNHCIAGFPPYDPAVLLRWAERVKGLEG